MNTASNATPSVIGHFDAIHEEIAYGWAYAPQQPGQRLTIELIDENGELVGYGMADHHREDLESQGIGDGHHQFKLALAYSLYDGEAHTLSAIEPSSGQILPGQHTFGPATRTFDIDLMPRAEGQQWLINHLRQGQPLTRQKAEALLNAYRISSALHETNHHQDAHSTWHAIGQATALEALAHCKQGELHLLQGQPNDALASYQQAQESAPEAPWPHIGLANALQQLGRFQEAEHAIARALALAPEHTPAHMLAQARQRTLERIGLPERMTALVNQGEQHAAQTLLINRLLAQPDDEQASELLGQLLHPAPEEDEEPLPGADTRLAFQRQERVLNALLNHVDTQLNEPRP